MRARAGMDRFLTERRFVALTFLAFVAVTLFTTLHHEAWGDETDVWVVARDGGLPAIFDSTASRGTPALWYLMVWPFAALGAPYLAQQLLHLLIAWGAVLLFLRSAPFPRVTRALFALSYYPAFEYSVIARPYGLLMLLLLLVIHQWHTRQERPVRLAVTIALLANTTLHGLIIAAVVGTIYLVDALPFRRGMRSLRPILIMLVGGLAAVAQLWPRGGGQGVYTYVTVETMWYTFAAAFFPGMRQADGLMLTIPIVLIVVLAISRRAAPLLFLMGSIIPLLVVYVYVWMGGLRHAGIVMLVVVASVWMAKGYGSLRAERFVTAALTIAFAWSVVAAWNAWTSEKEWAYSGSRDAAVFLEPIGTDVELVACAPIAPSVLAYLPGRRFLYACLGEYGSYSKWDAQFTATLNIPIETCVACARASLPSSGKKWLLVVNAKLPPSMAQQFRLRDHTTRQIWGRLEESYWIYEPLVP